jgi:hypothetical protein
MKIEYLVGFKLRCVGLGYECQVPDIPNDGLGMQVRLKNKERTQNIVPNNS